MSIKSAGKPSQAPELLPSTTAETAPQLAPIMSSISSGLVPSTLSSPGGGAVSMSSAATAPMQNVLVYVGNDNYAHAYTVSKPPPLPHSAPAPATGTGPYQLQQQHHHQTSGAGGGGTAKPTQAFYPNNPTYLHQLNGYKPLAVADQNNLVRYLVSTADASSDNTIRYVTVNNNNHIIHNGSVNLRCDSAKSEAAESPGSGLNSPEDQQLLMGVDSNLQGNNNCNSNNGVAVTSSRSVVPVIATVAPPGTLVGVGGNVATGTAPVPVATAPEPYVISANVVNIPYGWKRLIANGVVIYVSPSNVVLTTSEQAKDYLQTSGTCKCGLECPFHFDSTFNFDIKVVGKPNLLTPDVNVDLTKLCNHKRKLQTQVSTEVKMIEPINSIQNDYGSAKKKPKVNSSKKLVKVTTATSTIAPYNSPISTTIATATRDSLANNNAAVLHPLDKNLCNTTTVSNSNTVRGPQFAQQQSQEQIWQLQMNGPMNQKPPQSTTATMFNNMDSQSYYRYQQAQLGQQQQQQMLPPQISDMLMHRYPAPPQQSFPLLTSQVQSNPPCVATTNNSNAPPGGVAATMSVQNQNDHMVLTSAAAGTVNGMGRGFVGSSNGTLVGQEHTLNGLGNHLLSGQPTVEQSGPGRPSVPPPTLPHPTALPNNIRLPHPVCYDPSTGAKQHQQHAAGIRLPVPYANAGQHLMNGMHMRLPVGKQQWNNGGMMRGPPPPPQQQLNGNIYDRVPPLPQHSAGANGPNVWPEEVTTGRKKPATKLNPHRAQKKPRPNYHLLTDPQQQPCPNVDVRQMSGQSPQQLNNLVQQQQQQQHGFNTTANSVENGGTNNVITTASPSFIDDPSGYLAQQTALLNSTISGQGLQMNGFPCNTPPLLQPDQRPHNNSAPSAPPKQPPPPYQQHHRTTSRQQQHFSGGQVFVSQHQQLAQQQQQHQHMHQVVVNSGGVVTSECQQTVLGNNLQGRCTDCLIGGQEQLMQQTQLLPQQQQIMGNKRNYSRTGRGDATTGTISAIGTNEDPVTSSTFFDHPLPNTPTCSTSTSTSKNITNSCATGGNFESRPQSRPLLLASVSSPDSRPIQGGTISTSNVSPQLDTNSNSSTCSSVTNMNGVASPPQQQQQIVMSKVATSQHGVLLNGTAPRLCVTTMASNIANLANGVRTLQTQALPIITSPTITLTSRHPGIAQQLPQQFHLTTSPQQQQQHHQQLVALATAVTSGNVCNGTTAVVVSSGANGTLVAKSPLEMVQSVVSRIQLPQTDNNHLNDNLNMNYYCQQHQHMPHHQQHHAHPQQQQHYHQQSPPSMSNVIKSSPPTHHTTNSLPPGHILVSSGGQLLMASTSAPMSAAQQHHHHLMAPPPPKQQLAMPPISVSPMVTNVTASVTQVIPTVAQQVLGQQTVLVNALSTPSFLLQPGVTMTMDGLANLQQIPHLLTTNNILQHHHPNQAAAAAALMSPTQDILSALAKTNNNGAISPGSAIGTTVSNTKKGKKRKSGGGPLGNLTPNGAIANVTTGLVAQPVTSMLQIAAGNAGAGVVSPQSFTPQLQMHSPQTPVMQALTIVPGKAGGPPQLVMNTSPAQATTQHINLLQPVNLLNNTTGVHIQNYPTIQQFILPNLGGMVVNADGTATILPATATTSPAQAAADANHHAHAQPLQMQLQLQNVNGQNVLTPITHTGGHITFGSPPTSNPGGLSMLIRPAVSKQPTQSVHIQHSPAAAAQFLSPTASAGGGAATGQQFVVNGTTFTTSGQLSPLVTAAGISPRAAGPTNGGEYAQTTLMVPCTPVSSNGGNTYVHQNTTIVQQQTTMVTNNGQPAQATTRSLNNNQQQQLQQQHINLRPVTSQHSTTLNMNLNEQNQYIISDKSLILQTQAQLQHQQQQIQQQLQQARQQLSINQTVNLINQAAAAAQVPQQYRQQSASTQTVTGFHQMPNTKTTPANTFCHTSNAIGSSLSTASIVAGGTPQTSSTPPTPGSPPDTTTLSPLASQGQLHIPVSENIAGQQVIGGNRTTILVSSPVSTNGSTNTTNISIGGGQSPMAGADTTTYSTSSGHSTDDGLSPAPSNCSSVSAGSNGSYAVTSGTSVTQLLTVVDNALTVVGGGNNGRIAEQQQQQQQQQGSMAMVHCVSSSEPDVSEFTFIDQLDWTKNSFTLQNQSVNLYNQRNTKKNQKNLNMSAAYNTNTTFKSEMENKTNNNGRRTYSNTNLSKSSMDLLQYGNNQQHQNQTTTLNYPESASTVQYVTGNNSNDATEAIIVQGNYNENSQKNSQQRAFNNMKQTASTVVLDPIGGSYANNIVEELLKQQQLDALQPIHQNQEKDPLLKNNSRSKYEKLHQQQEQRRKQQQINNIRQTIAALFDDDDSINEVATTKDTIQSAIDSVLSEETCDLEGSEADTKVDTMPGRPFAVGDLVWAPANGCPAWPGQVIDGDIGKDLTAGHKLIRWFGTATTSSVPAHTLCTLTQGLELHHLARKRARTSRKLNSQLEKAIQQAMAELDKMSDNRTVEKCSANLSIADGSSIKEKKTSEKSRKISVKVGTNKDMTTVKKSSSRLRSQR